ncbi:MAG: hypothetical protein HUU16_08610 [Candidatus Omnitrophica bacterium]|nr:hypothetical protein [Candidatus Omnitrophota bacterium]
MPEEPMEVLEEVEEKRETQRSLSFKRDLLIGSLGLLIGLEVAAIYWFSSQSAPPGGSFRLVWDILFGGTAIGLLILSPLLIAVAARAFVSVFSAFPRWFWWGALVLMAWGNWWKQDQYELFFCILAGCAVFILGSVPIWLATTFLTLYGLGAFLSPASTPMLVGLMSLCFLSFPSNISLRRFLRPRRWVL